MQKVYEAPAVAAHQKVAFETKPSGGNGNGRGRGRGRGRGK